MSWKDRLRPCVYISPSGSEFTLLYDDVSREVGKKAPVTEFPGQNSGAVQDLGQSTASFPLTVYLGGADYDIEADRFWTALNEPGPAGLQHPRYGNIAVVPVSVSQSENFVDGAGRATFTIQFVEAIEARLEFPAGIGINPESITAQVDEAVAAASGSVEDLVVEDPGLIAQIGEGVTTAIEATLGVFDTITGITNDTRASIDGAIRDILGTVDELVTAPATLINALANLYRLPAKTITSVKAKVTGYTRLYQDSIGRFADITSEYAELLGLIDEANSNAIAAATADASGTGTQETGADAAETNALLSTILPAGNDYESTANTRQALTLAQLAQWNLITDLPIEQKTTLEYDEALLPLIDRLYKNIDSLDETIELFIRFNDLGGNSILIVPAGTTVRWYER